MGCGAFGALGVCVVWVAGVVGGWLAALAVLWLSRLGSLRWRQRRLGIVVVRECLLRRLLIGPPGRTDAAFGLRMRERVCVIALPLGHLGRRWRWWFARVPAGGIWRGFPTRGWLVGWVRRRDILVAISRLSRVLGRWGRVIMVAAPAVGVFPGVGAVARRGIGLRVAPRPWRALLVRVL